MAASARSTAIKRIKGDVREMMTNPSDQYVAAPLEDNMFDWHFTLRGPRDTEFEGGVYHGRILLPADYPFKPPNIILLTPNGRFEVKKKICLSISAHHPEEWQPAWGGASILVDSFDEKIECVIRTIVRLILEALISFMPTKGEGAIGALNYHTAERRKLAKQSIDFCCGTCGKVIDLLPEERDTGDGNASSQHSEQIASLHLHMIDSTENTDQTCDQKLQQPHASTKSPSVSFKTEDTASSAQISANSPGPENLKPPMPISPATHIPPNTPNDFINNLLGYLKIAIVVALFAMIYRLLLQAYGIL